MDEWRQTFKVLHLSMIGILFSGAVDDVLEKDNGQLIVCDIKATSKINLIGQKPVQIYFSRAYERQLGVTIYWQRMVLT